MTRSADRALKLVLSGDTIALGLSPAIERSLTWLREINQEADAVLTNLESVVLTGPTTPQASHRGTMVASSLEDLDVLVRLGYNMFNTANNHANDFTFEGVRQTLQVLDERGLAHAGSGLTLAESRRPAYRTTAAGRVALLGTGSTKAEVSLAADPRGGVPGRPGINPLRFDEIYICEDDLFTSVSKVADGITAMSEPHVFAGHPGRARSRQIPDGPQVQVAGKTFVKGSPQRVASYPDDRDVEATEAWIREARRRAEVVVVSMHCHEGANGGYNTAHPADFIQEAARRFVDAGADVIMGHGPHRLRGIEVYRNRPILYSLGNFFFMLDAIDEIPAEAYERQGLGVDATPGEYHATWSRGPDGEPIGFFADDAFWTSVLTQFSIEGDRWRLDLVPVDLQLDQPVGVRGVPKPASTAVGERILTDLVELSAEFQTGLVTEEREGRLVGLVEGTWDQHAQE